MENVFTLKVDEKLYRVNKYDGLLQTKTSILNIHRILIKKIIINGEIIKEDSAFQNNFEIAIGEKDHYIYERAGRNRNYWRCTRCRKGLNQKY